MYAQGRYCLERVPAVAEVEPFKTALYSNREAMAKLSMKTKILDATLTGMSVEEFRAEVTKWLAAAKVPRWRRPYAEPTSL